MKGGEDKAGRYLLFDVIFFMREFARTCSFAVKPIPSPLLPFPAAVVVPKLFKARLLFKARYLVPCSMCGLNTQVGG